MTTRSRLHSSTFQGGPYDGYPTTEDDTQWPVHTFDFGEQIAVYQFNDGRFDFVGIRDRDESDDDTGNTCEDRQ